MGTVMRATYRSLLPALVFVCTPVALLMALRAYAAPLAVPVAGSAAPITYDVDLQLPIGLPGGVTGAITTNGTLGPLSTGDILSWDLRLVVGSSSESLSTGNSYVSSSPVGLSCTLCTPPPLTASRSLLIFDFAQIGTSSDPGLIRFENSGSALLFLASRTGFPDDGLISAQIDTSPTTAVFAQLGGENGPMVIGASVPEPGTLALMLGGLGALGLFATRKQGDRRAVFASAGSAYARSAAVTGILAARRAGSRPAVSPIIRAHATPSTASLRVTAK